MRDIQVGDRITQLRPEGWQSEYADLDKPLYVYEIESSDGLWICNDLEEDDYGDGLGPRTFHTNRNKVKLYVQETKIGGRAL